MFADNIPRYCGYCKDPITNIPKKTNYKYTLTLKSIPIDILEEMVSKGWTRCGQDIYLTCYEKTCCKLYQPRININNFQISNEQKKIMKRFRKYLSGQYEENKLKNKEIKPEKIAINDIYKNKITKKVGAFLNSQSFLDVINKYIIDEIELAIYLSKSNETKIRKINNKKYNFDYTCDLIYMIKNLYISLYNKNNKNKINKINNKINNDKILKNFINDLYNKFIENYKPIDEYITFNEETGHINFLIKNREEYQNFNNEVLLNLSEQQKVGNNKNIINFNTNKNNINQYNINKETYNNKIKEDKKSKFDKNENNKIIENKNNNKEQKIKYELEYFPEIVPEPEIYLPLKHTYTIELTKNIILTEKEERFLLYQKYEKTIHKEKEVPLKDHNLYWGKSILQKNKRIPIPYSLKYKTKHPELYPEFYGTYNFIHRIDNKIVAVTVCDILPHMFISDYCYYDPDYSFLDLGVLTVIREIEYMKSFNNLIDKNFIYYTLGEMCLICKKLKYKANYRPTEIMDYYTGKYIYLTEEVKKLIEDNKCHFLADNSKNPNIKLFTWLEIQDKYFNCMVNVFGEKLNIDTFFNLYLEGNESAKKAITFNIYRFLEIIDKDIYSKIEFYFEMNNF